MAHATEQSTSFLPFLLKWGYFLGVLSDVREGPRESFHSIDYREYEIIKRSSAMPVNNNDIESSIVDVNSCMMIAIKPE